MSFTPTSFYNIFPNDYLTLSYNGASNKSPDQCSRTEGSSSILARTPSVQSTMSHASAPTLRSSSSDELHDCLDWKKGGHDAQPAATMGNAENKQCIVTRRTRGPNRRRPGTGYNELMGKLPKEVQDALNRDYRNCCEVVVNKDSSTIQKHKFSNRHCTNLPQELQELLPSFTCPAFVAMHGLCRSAKPGRYDSTERHCQNCPGYKDLKTASRLYPIELTKGEFNAVQDFRKSNAPPSSQDKDPFPLLLQNAVMKVLAMMLGYELSSLPVDGPVYTTSDSIDNASATDAVANERHSFTSRDKGGGYYGHYCSGSSLRFT